MDSELLLQCYNCYIKKLSMLKYGRFKIDYDILYNALLAIKNNITDTQYIQFFKSNISC